MRQSEGRPRWSFYDGPPFATGLPHYGHILAGTIKDIVCRYAHQTGHYVERRFGWDCHGLPIEFEIDKMHKINSRQDVLDMGIDKYNAACRSIVMRFSAEWEKTVKRVGRWIDFQNDYKTMNLSYMESCWWVFGRLHEQGLVYRGFKVMAYSCALNTPLSNFEVQQNYKTVDDPAVVCTFPLKDEPDVCFVAWTTTPWTLPSNLALCVNPNMEYVKIKDTATGKVYILMATRLVQLFPELGNEKKKKEALKKLEELERFPGSKLKGTQYTPPFDYFESTRATGSFQVITGDFVTDDAGTGIVHCAPAFGEEDYNACLKNNVIRKGEDWYTKAIDDNGRFTDKVPEWKGKFVKDADKEIIAHLKGKGRMASIGVINHSYPFCWRSETPLIYRAVPSTFINVEAVKDRLVANNKLTYWVPGDVRENRFHNWLQNARDWAVSRNRFWGTPIPMWVSDDGEEVVVVTSIADLEERTGVKPITDLHRDSIDHLTIPSQQGKGLLRRVDEVFDCWFESGSMPYAQVRERKHGVGSSAQQQHPAAAPGRSARPQHAAAATRAAASCITYICGCVRTRRRGTRARPPRCLPAPCLSSLLYWRCTAIRLPLSWARVDRCQLSIQAPKECHLMRRPVTSWPITAWHVAVAGWMSARLSAQSLSTDLLCPAPARTIASLPPSPRPFS